VKILNRRRHIVSVHPLEAVAQDHIAVYLVNPGVQHIGLDGAPEIVEGAALGLVLAIRDSDLPAGRDERVFQPPRGYDRLMAISKFKVMVDRPGEVSWYCC
jgi:hypothetical protein